MVSDCNFFIVGFTSPAAMEDPSVEADKISAFLDCGAVDFFHFRKKETDITYAAGLMEKIPTRLHMRLILHSHFELAEKFNFGGIHFNKETSSSLRNLPSQLFITRSCHSLSEIENSDSRLFTYSFLSPIYDSISKKGYISNFDVGGAELISLNRKHRIVALGGVTPEKFPNLFKSKFAGAALLGYLWSPESDIETNIDSILLSRNSLK